MKTTNQEEPSGKVTASLVSVVGLILVWGIVWANLPSKDELLSAQLQSRAVVAPVVPELDLTIPGVPPSRPSNVPDHERARRPAASEPTGAFPIPNDGRARQIAEMKCDAEVQQFCPDSLTGEERQRCMVQRLKRLPPSCQQIVRQRMVRWKVVEGYKAACAEDMERLCPGVEPGDGRMLMCLQERTQDISEGCYQRLPKGQLLLRN